MNGKAVIVFGGSGFLGSHVADFLSEAGYQVRIFDVKPSVYLRSGQEMIVGDILDLSQVIKAAEGRWAVYNFAGIADIDEASHKPVETARLNVLGNIHTLEAAREAGAQRFIFASSIYVYSEKGSFYRASKQASEHFIETYQERYGLDYTILRYGSLYGRRADHRNGIHRLLYSALTQRKIEYGGTGEELREYIHVEDAARLSVEILRPEFANQHVVLTGQHSMRVRDVAEMIREMLGGKVELAFIGNGQNVEGHYTITPYAFRPRLGKKLVSPLYIDMGQGLLDCLAEIHGQTTKGMHQKMDLLVPDTTID